MKKTGAKPSPEKEAELELEKDLVFFLNAAERREYVTLILIALFLALALPRLEWPRDALGWAAYALVALVLLAAVANAILSMKERKRVRKKRRMK